MSIDSLFSLYDDFGAADYIGEPVSQREHMLQAASLAARDNQRPEVVLASLLHDVGHLLALRDNRPSDSLGAHDHGTLGAQAVTDAGLPHEVAALVRDHVDAKRYLVATDMRYHAQLSPSSVITLKAQGGPMSTDEADAFAKSDTFREAIRIRRYDEAAKLTDPDPPTLPLSHFKRIAQQLVEPQTHSPTYTQAWLADSGSSPARTPSPPY